ncbi:uncharacterized protein J3R85_020828 [Psidium guajava]|nr:uncharacterized protein J3R85_020828 [Psidium guajava]
MTRNSSNLTLLFIRNSRTFSLERWFGDCLVVIKCFIYLALINGSSDTALAHFAKGIFNFVNPKTRKSIYLHLPF